MLGVTLFLAAAGFAPCSTATTHLGWSPIVAQTQQCAISPMMFSGGSSSTPKKRIVKKPIAKKVGAKVGNPSESPSQLFGRLAAPIFVPPSRPDLLPKQPIAKKPVAKKPIAKNSQKPIAKKPIAKQPIVKKPIAKKPIAKKPVAKKPAAKKPVAKKTIGRVVPTIPAVKKFADPVKQAAATRAAFEKRQAAEFKKRGQTVGRVVLTKVATSTVAKKPTVVNSIKKARDPAKQAALAQKQAAAIRAAFEKREKAELRQKMMAGR